MQVLVKTFASLRDVAERETMVRIGEGAAVGDLMEVLFRRYPGLEEALFDTPGELKRFVNILVNGRNIHFIRGMDTVLQDGDRVVLFPPAGGVMGERTEIHPHRTRRWPGVDGAEESLPPVKTGAGAGLRGIVPIFAFSPR
ncbi:MAG TPA: MoaD family protein [Methanoculleus sp.]|mgnify:CR=1 FL=1|nr:MoaD family protein [Methanoculleus sp.]